MILSEEPLSKVFNEKHISFTLKELEELMNYEIEKDPEEMDTDLIDMCAAILAERYDAYYQKQTNNYRRKIG